jgi:5-methyltetrahydropteroyltriglutamate--homocysteine methyltransferase
MQDIIFIDEGSLPTPEGVTREWVKAAAENRNEDEKLFSIIRDAFRRKLMRECTFPHILSSGI